MSTPAFAHLHCHSHYSLLDGASSIDRLVSRTVELGMNALAITDHGNLHGALEFYEAAKARGFILYPGKLTQVETFRVGCIGAIGPNEMRQAVNAVRETLAEMGIPDGTPAL